MVENFNLKKIKEKVSLAEIMQKRWFDLFSELGIDSAKAQKYFDQLLNAYGESERFYHNMEHISRMLEKIESFSADIEDMPVLKLAIWYHDVVYDPKATDNEEQSANLAESIMLDLGLEKDKVQKIKDYILATKDHNVSPEDAFDLVLLIDVDFETLGGSWEDFEKYRKAIRKEYSWLSDEKYIDGTRKFFNNMLARDRIYNTQVMYDKLEDQARANLNRALKEL